jgi:hypothetical protein
MTTSNCSDPTHPRERDDDGAWCPLCDGTDDKLTGVAKLRAAFTAHWSGTAEELDVALEAFYEDIRSSYLLALKTAWPLSGDRGDRQVSDVILIVDDYVYNHYFA